MSRRGRTTGSSDPSGTLWRYVRASGEPGSPAPASSNAARRATCDTGPMPTRVLIVDDNRPFLEAARVSPRAAGPVRRGVALTAAEALRRAGELQPDLALVDIMLAEESGFECARDLIDTIGRRPSGHPDLDHAEADFAISSRSPGEGLPAEVGAVRRRNSPNTQRSPR